MKVFIKVQVIKELPADVQPKNVITNIGYAAYYAPTKKWIDQRALSEVNPDWWLKEVEFPDEVQISFDADEYGFNAWGEVLAYDVIGEDGSTKMDISSSDFKKGVNYILDKLK